MTPVHLCAVPAPNFKIVQGKGLVKVTGSPLGRMTHAFCQKCGTHIYQCPAGAPFRALYPVTFDEARPLPSHLHPSRDFNYENRAYERPLKVVPVNAMKDIDETVKCNCVKGGVKFNVKGAVLSNALDHATEVTTELGMSPVHLLTVPAESISKIQGAELIRITKTGATNHAFCKDCGCHVYNFREAHTRSVYPTTFHIEAPDSRVSCGVNSLLPEGMQPREHLHYSQRTFSWDNDALLKTD